MDCRRFEKSTGPFHEGVVDCGLSGSSTRPFHEGVVDGGLSKTLEPITSGGVLQSDVRIMYSNVMGWPLWGMCVLWQVGVCALLWVYVCLLHDIPCWSPQPKLWRRTEAK